MANSPQARYRAKRSLAVNMRRRSQGATVRTAIKKIDKLTADSNTENTELQSALTATQKLLDQAAGKKLIHVNKARRIKSRLVAKVKKTLMERSANKSTAKKKSKAKK